MTHRVTGPAMHFLGLTALCAFLVSCDSPTGPRRLVPALIQGFEPGDPTVTLTVGDSSVRIDVVSYGNSCRKKGELRTSVSEESRTILVSPFDWYDPNMTCDDILLTFDHSATVDVQQQGMWTVVVIGEDIAGDPARSEHSVQIG